MTTSNKIAKSALIIIILSLVSKFLGFIREVFIAAKFGSGIETDTYFVAMTGTALISGIISSAISTTFIPVLSEVATNEGEESKNRYISNMINIIIFISTFLVLLAWITSPILIKLIAKGFYGEQYVLAITLNRIGLPMILFSGIIGILTGFLQSEHNHLSTAILGLPYNLIYIIFLVFFSYSFGVKGLMVTSVIAVLSQLIIQILAVKKNGFKYKFIFDIKDIYVKKVLYLSIPILIGVAMNDINVMIDRTLASSLNPGSISALNYANKLNGLILGVFISAITTVIFPVLSKEVNKENIVEVKSVIAYGVNIILIITVPATVGLIVLSNPIVEIAFQRGEFDATATLMTSQALIFYSIGLVAMSLQLLVARIYYSFQDTKTPLKIGILSIGSNIVLNLIFIKYMGHSGLALGTSIATIIANIFMFYNLKKKIGSLGTKGYITTFIRTGIASIIMGAVAYFTYYELYIFLGASKFYNLISLLVAVGLAVIVYVVLCYVLKVEEVREVIGKIKVRLTK